MKKEIATLTEGQLEALNNAFPAFENDSSRTSLPRFGMLSKDVVSESGTGKNKKIIVEESGGTFYTEKDLGAVDEETGKKVWTREFIEGETVDVIVMFHRRQLRMFDSSLNKFYSTPIFDNAMQKVPLYLDKLVVATGTQAELQSRYPALTAKGKPSSKLKEETIIFVIYEGTLFQMNLSQSSKWGFKDYAKGDNPNKCITTLGSIEETFGTNTYRKVTFTKGRMINGEEFELVMEAKTGLEDQVAQDEKLFLGSGEQQTAQEKAEKDFDAMK